MLNKCEQCGEELKVKRRRFCSRVCSGLFNGANKPELSQESKDKISASLSATLIDKGVTTRVERFCPQCGSGFLGRKKKVFCSSSCSSKHAWTKPEYQDKIKQSMLNAPHKGWKSRSESSYPELFWENVLTQNGLVVGVDFFREKHVTKRSLGVDSDGGYFLDFFFPAWNLDLEIDGKQHKDRQEQDQQRDSLLRSNGVQVVRMPWLGLKKKGLETWEQTRQVLGILNSKELHEQSECRAERTFRVRRFL